ncbi:hypothetical protein RB195_019194 [Necator americanus]|uniref:Uncharacterized protein n=1 Tax=Necator americanus TaxID=51031 RepID=A0ABR1CFW6_NECAM
MGILRDGFCDFVAICVSQLPFYLDVEVSRAVARSFPRATHVGFTLNRHSEKQQSYGFNCAPSRGFLENTQRHSVHSSVCTRLNILYLLHRWTSFLVVERHRQSCSVKISERSTKPYENWIGRSREWRCKRRK